MRQSRKKYQENVKPKLATITAWAHEGLTNKQVAENLRIAESTFYVYLKRHPELKDALKDGLDDAIAHVENAQYKSALGYDYEETKVIYNVPVDGQAVPLLFGSAPLHLTTTAR